MDPTMRLHAVLLIGDEVSPRLVDAFFAAGLTAVARPPSVDTFTRIRRRNYEALVVDGADRRRDVLEVVLNIRDYDEEVPVIVLGAERPAVREEFLRWLGVHWVDRRQSPEAIVGDVQAAADAGAKRGGSTGA